MMVTAFKSPSVEAGTGGHTRGGIPESQPCIGANPEDGPPRQVRLASHRVALWFESRNNHVERRVDVNIATEPSDGACEAEGKVDGLVVGGPPKDLAHAAYAFQVL